MPIVEFWLALSATTLLVVGFSLCLLLDKRRSLWVDRRFPGTGRTAPLYGDYRTLEHRMYTNQRLYRAFKARRWPIGGAVLYLTPCVIPIDREVIEYVLSEEFIKLPTIRWNRELIRSWQEFEDAHYEALLGLIAKESETIATSVSSSEEGQCVKAIVEQFTMRILIRSVFGTNCDHQLETVKQLLLENRTSLLEKIIQTAFPGSTNVQQLLNVFIPNGNSKWRQLMKELFTNASNDRGPSFLAFLKQKQSDEDLLGMVAPDDTQHSLLHLMRTVFYTTSGTIVACLYELARHHDIQDRLHAVLKNCDNSMTDYLDNVITETLRKYPPQDEISFTSLTSCRLPECDLVIPRNTRVIIPTYALHRDADCYPDPMRFDPERPVATSSHFYHPLGVDSVNLGSTFAMLMVRVALTKLLLHWQVDVSTSTPTELDASPESALPYHRGKVELVIRRYGSSTACQ
ncbi:cytochrome P450 6B1-like isoform X3 [Anopheles aquasalis]|uniref:cytochrome P450 6B1-like isoform X3 n=1 Tax=Anopheles aquasalis TaxID=42839 RepID=UPI00215A23F2|nr:cytochrome P450 6B1-like isoform X3 [Anopheles aquasalis]